MDTLGVRRFLKYTLLSGSTFLFDLLVLYGLTKYLHVPYYLSTPLALLLAVSVNYPLSRRAVFAGTERAFHHGYAYYVGLALLSALVITVAVVFLVTYVHLGFLLARVLVGVVTGTGNYLLNLYLNFRVAGKHRQQ